MLSKNFSNYPSRPCWTSAKAPSAPGIKSCSPISRMSSEDQVRPSSTTSNSSSKSQLATNSIRSQKPQYSPTHASATTPTSSPQRTCFATSPIVATRSSTQIQEVREKPRKPFEVRPEITYSAAVEQSKRAIRNDPRYSEFLQLDPLDCKSFWLYYFMIEATHKTGNFSTKLFRAQQYFTLTQGDRDLKEYHELLSNAAKANLHDFGSEDPNLAGYVRLSDFTSNRGYLPHRRWPDQVPHQDRRRSEGLLWLRWAPRTRRAGDRLSYVARLPGLFVDFSLLDLTLRAPSCLEITRLTKPEVGNSVLTDEAEQTSSTANTDATGTVNVDSVSLPRSGCPNTSLVALTNADPSPDSGIMVAWTGTATGTLPAVPMASCLWHATCLTAGTPKSMHTTVSSPRRNSALHLEQVLTCEWGFSFLHLDEQP